MSKKGHFFKKGGYFTTTQYTQNVLKFRALVAHMVGSETANLKVIGSIPLPTENITL